MKTCDLNRKDRRIQEQVLDAAKNHLLKTFGIKVVESETKKGNFFLINSLTENQQDEDTQHIVWSDKENAQMALTFVILGLVFMSNGQKITEDNLFKFLKQMDLYDDDDDVDQKSNKRRKDANRNSIVDTEVIKMFDGDIKTFVNDVLVSKQHYLMRTKVETGDPEAQVFSYTWGERARQELNEKDVLSFVCECYECEPRMFKEQFDIVSKKKKDDETS